jgi:predicted TIM-barrel fold metal-dependent hydrolase
LASSSAPSGAAIPACPPPPYPETGPKRVVVPPGAVDTQAHVIGLPPAYPFVAQRSYTPTEATAAHYLQMLDAAGMTYGVLIQVSVHGTDNRLMLEVLRAHPQRLKGIAVAPLGLKDAEYRAMKEAGVVGLRLNVLYGGGVGFDKVADYGKLCAEMGWHMQFLTRPDVLRENKHHLAKLPVPFVVDHMGHVDARKGVGDPDFQVLVGLVRDGCWVKLSGAYRMIDTGPLYPEVTPFAQALFAAGPDRCLWGSDWPHVANYGPMPSVGELLDRMADWVPARADQHKIFVANPHRLYGFSMPPA